MAAKDFTRPGVLAKCHVNIVQTGEVAEYTNYQSELKFLLEDKERMKYVANMIKQVSQTGNTLVLTGRISNGNLLQEMISGSEFVQGAMKVTDRKDAYDEINQATNSITIATYGVASVGINIPRIFNLVLLEP